MGFFNSVANFIGVDVGVSGVKVIELSKINGKAHLVNYGFSEEKGVDKSDWLDDYKKTAGVINKVLSESGVKSRSVYSASPAFSVFSSIINIPNVVKNDLAYAIEWEAKKVIPMPIEEMILDWKKIDKDPLAGNIGESYLLTGAPKTVVKKHLDTFKEAGLSLLGLEPETFSLIRALIGEDKTTVIILEIGSGTSDVIFVEKGNPIFSRSVNVGGDTITKAIARHLNITTEKAEQFKHDMGSISTDNEVISKLIVNAIAPILNEIKYVINMYQNNGKTAEKIILSGGSSLIPGLVEYLSKSLNINVHLGDPWTFVSYPEDLRQMLDELGPRMTVAIGLALQNLNPKK